MGSGFGKAPVRNHPPPRPERKRLPLVVLERDGQSTAAATIIIQALIILVLPGFLHAPPRMTGKEKEKAQDPGKPTVEVVATLIRDRIPSHEPLHFDRLGLHECHVGVSFGGLSQDPSVIVTCDQC